MSTTLITSRDSKGRQAMNIFEAVYNKAKLDDLRAQRLNENGGELKAGLRELIERLSISNQYVDEEISSGYTYPDSYVLRPIGEQVTELAKLFDLDATQALAYVENLPDLPEGAEGWFAIPRWQALSDSYNGAVEVVLGRLGDSRIFYNYRQGALGEDRLRQHAQTAAALQQLAEAQEGDILIVAAQFGLWHRGRSVRRAREVFVEGEFGFGTVSVISMLLVHPERLVRWEQLHMDCAGDEYRPDGCDVFDSAPYVNFVGDEVWFIAFRVDRPFAHFGSVSGFLPQIALCASEF